MFLLKFILFNSINTYCVVCIRHTIHSEHIQFYDMYVYVYMYLILSRFSSVNFIINDCEITLSSKMHLLALRRVRFEYV